MLETKKNGTLLRWTAWIANTYDRSTSVTVLLQELKVEPLGNANVLAGWLSCIIPQQYVAVPPDELDLVLNDRPVRGTELLRSCERPKTFNII